MLLQVLAPGVLLIQPVSLRFWVPVEDPQTRDLLLAHASRLDHTVFLFLSFFCGFVADSLHLFSRGEQRARGLSAPPASFRPLSFFFPLTVYRALNMVWPSRGVGCYVSELCLEIPTDYNPLNLSFDKVLLVLAFLAALTLADLVDFFQEPAFADASLFSFVLHHHPPLLFQTRRLFVGC